MASTNRSTLAALCGDCFPQDESIEWRSSRPFRRIGVWRAARRRLDNLARGHDVGKKTGEEAGREMMMVARCSSPSSLLPLLLRIGGMVDGDADLPQSGWAFDCIECGRASIDLETSKAGSDWLERKKALLLSVVVCVCVFVSSTISKSSLTAYPSLHSTGELWLGVCRRHRRSGNPPAKRRVMPLYQQVRRRAI